MFKRGIAILLIGQVVIIGLMVGLPSLAQDNPPFAYADALEPENVVASYFNAINLKDYNRAYNYWESEPSGATYAQFVTGYATTESVDAYLRLPTRVDVGAGNRYAEIPVILVATHTDETVHYFAGCYVVHGVNVPVGNNPEPDPNWYLRSADVEEVDDMNAAEVALDDLCSLNELG